MLVLWATVGLIEGPSIKMLPLPLPLEKEVGRETRIHSSKSGNNPNRTPVKASLRG